MHSLLGGSGKVHVRWVHLIPRLQRPKLRISIIVHTLGGSGFTGVGKSPASGFFPSGGEKGFIFGFGGRVLAPTEN